ncbi:MAG: hypothetical protein AABX99_00700 [Nanoarchaeota archaeon]
MNNPNYDKQVREYADEVSKYPEESYPSDSIAGDELQKILFALIDIKNRHLSPTVREQKKELEQLLLSKKIRKLA